MSKEPGKLKLFFADLRRRKVTRLASIYVVAGFGIIEALDIIGGRFQISEAAIQILMIAVIAGFPLAMILGWIFDLTPRGIERTKPLTQEEKYTLPSLSWRPSWISLILLLMLVMLSFAFFTVPRTNALGFQNRDWILLADLENNTGDEVFDQSLVHALGITINQSKYVNIYPRRRMQEVLQRMKLDNVDRIDTPLALEIADRENIKAVLVLTISELNNTYLLSTSLLNTYSGVSVRSRQVEAKGKEEVLDALNELAISVRRDLGETLAKILQRRLPLPKATTPSLKALKFYTDGAVSWSNGQWQEAQDLWARAIELDSGFAWANASLGMAKEWLVSSEASQVYYDRALGQMDRVTERERLWISALIASGKEAIDAYHTFLRQYPDDRDGWYNLGNALKEQGREEEAIEAYQHSLNIDPIQSWPHVNMAVSYDGLGQFEKAAMHFEKAAEFDPDFPKRWVGDVNRIYGFVLVKLGNLEAAREHFEVLLEGDEGGKSNGLRSLALLNMYQGQHLKAIEQFKQAIVINQRSNYPLSEYRNRMYMARAYQSLGMEAELAEQLRLGQELAETGGWAPNWTVFLALRQVDAGDIGSAGGWIDTWIERGWAEGEDEWAVELVRGEIALAEGDPSKAVSSLELADQLKKDGLVQDALGRAYYANGQYEQAEETFLETIRLMRLGYECQEPWVLAHYRLGCLYQDMGQEEKSLFYLERFLELWGSGDAGLMGVDEARRLIQNQPA
jgi:tetratricopeptide (TPR) repeat protein